MTGPERIFATGDGTHGVWMDASLPLTPGPGGVEYIRADTLTLGVVVKPLVWEHHPMGYIAAPPTGRAYIIDIRVKNRVFFVKGMEPPPKVDTLYEAKALAQADYTARILAALEPPDHAALLAHAMRLPEVTALVGCGQRMRGHLHRIADDGDLNATGAMIEWDDALAALEAKP